MRYEAAIKAEQRIIATGVTSKAMHYFDGPKGYSIAVWTGAERVEPLWLRNARDVSTFIRAQKKPRKR